MVVIKTLLQNGPVLFPEILIGGGIIVSQLLQFLQHALGNAAFHARQNRVVLQHFAADVERQIFAIDHALQEAQIGRQQTFGVIGNEYATHIQFHAMLTLGIEQIIRLLRGDKEKTRIF